MDTKTAAGSNGNACAERLHVGIELSQSTWVLAFATKSGRRRRGTVMGGDVGAVLEAIGEAKQRLRLPEDIEVVTCQEAGRDGFWVHRELERAGVRSLVVDAASIEVNRRARRAKTDRLDAQKLVDQLVRYEAGEKRVWSVVRVPSPEAEDARRLDREWGRLKKERTAHVNRLRGLLATAGLRLQPSTSFLEDLAESPVQAGLRGELERQYERLALVEKHLRKLELERYGRMKKPEDAADRKAAQLHRLKGIGETSAWLLAKEFFGWRTFANRREVGAAAGLTGTPYDSGGGKREQGISKAGSKRVRTTMVQLAWRWLRWQPQSELALWFQKRFAYGGSRARRVGIVGVARKLLIALWRYVEQGVVPEGALVARNVA